MSLVDSDSTHPRSTLLPLISKKIAVAAVSLGLLVLCGLAVLNAWVMTVGDARHGRIDWTYPYSAYLVDYSTGFIRRAAIGAIIGHLTHGQSHLLLTSWLVFINYVVLIICVAALIMVNAKRKLETALLVFLLPSGIVMAGMMGGFFVWKEALFITALAVLGCGYNLAIRLPSHAAQRVLGRILIAALLLFTVFACLAQESFVFLAAPAFAYLLIALIRISLPPSHSEIRFSISYLMAVFGMFLVVGVFFHGSPAQLSRMWQHFSPLDRNLYAPGKYGDFEVIGLTVGKQLNIIGRIITSGYTWWYLSPLALFFLYCTAIACLVGGKARGWSLSYLVIAICAAPMFVIGADYGRWVMMIQMTFLIALLSLGRESLATIHILPLRMSSVESTLHRYESFCERIVRGHVVTVTTVLLLFTLTFSMPLIFVTNPVNPNVEGDFPAAVIYVVRYVKHHAGG